MITNVSLNNCASINDKVTVCPVVSLQTHFASDMINNNDDDDVIHFDFCTPVTKLGVGVGGGGGGILESLCPSALSRTIVSCKKTVLLSSGSRA